MQNNWVSAEYSVSEDSKNLGFVRSLGDNSATIDAVFASAEDNDIAGSTGSSAVAVTAAVRRKRRKKKPTRLTRRSDDDARCDFLTYSLRT